MDAHLHTRGGLETEFRSELSRLIRARYPLLYLLTYEEIRAEDMLQTLCRERSSQLYQWSRTLGIMKGATPVAGLLDPSAPLKWFEELNEKAILVLKDFHPYLKDPGIVRKLRDLSQSLKRSQKNIIILSPISQIPPELTKDITLIEMPLPSREEIGNMIEKSITSMQRTASSLAVQELIDAACGLTQEEIENVLAKSLVSTGKVDRIMVQEEKRQIVKKSGVLEFIESKQTQSCEIGGLHHLKSWLKVRRSGLSRDARAAGLPAPKGMLLVGVPGCGKSLTAMTVSREWQLPLVRLDLGRVFSGLVGSSESNIREALRTAEAISPCILWIDEIEKGLSGSQSSGGSDGGTSSRVFGTVLTWMQEKKTPVFVVATANDISQLPPEFLRKGRFDEIFFVDLPKHQERAEIFKIQLDHKGWNHPDLLIEELAKKSEAFSGAEIEQALVSARFDAFSESETLSQKHILKALSETVPLSKTMSDRIEHLRNWAVHRARPASITDLSLQENRFELRTQSLELTSHDPMAYGGAAE